MISSSYFGADGLWIVGGMMSITQWNSLSALVKQNDIYRIFYSVYCNENLLVLFQSKI